LTALLLPALLASAAHAQSNVKTYGLSAAMNQGLVIQSCQNDLTQVEGLAPVRLIVVTMPQSVQPEKSGNLALLMTTVNSGRIPTTIFFEDDTYVRAVVVACKTTGANNLIRIVDDRPAMTGAREYTAQPVTVPETVAAPMTATPAATSTPTAPLTTAAGSLNPAANAAAGIITLPAPSTVTMSGTVTDAGLVLSVRNGSTQTLRLDASELRVTSGVTSVPAGSAVTVLAPGLQTSITVPLSADARLGELRAVWNVSVPSLRVVFPLTATLQK